jgi:hypothetical protein
VARRTLSEPPDAADQDFVGCDTEIGPQPRHLGAIQPPVRHQ